MELATVGTRLASAAVGPLVKKLFVTEGPGAGLVDEPIRISGYVSFKGEKRSLTETDVRELAAKLVRQGLRTGERPIAADEEQAVADALGATLHALGDLTLTDLDAVRLGHQGFARELRNAGDRPERHLSAQATYFYERLVDTACLHILQFFTQRSTFVAHALVEQTRDLDEIISKVDELIRRSPLPGGEDAAFEQRYLEHLRKKHGKLTIYGIDLSSSPTRWPLDLAYLNLETTGVPSTRQPPAWFRRRQRGDVEAAWRALNDELLSAPGRSRPGSGTGAELDEHVRGMLRDWETSGDFDVRSLAEGFSSQEVRDVFAELAVLARRLGVPQPADEALASNRRVLLRGEAGSGKTTLVQWLAITAACTDLPDRLAYLYDRVPFVLPLRTLTRHGDRLPGPHDFLAATGCPLAGAQPDGWEDRVLRAGRGLVLVDGIDEVPEPERERTRRWLRELIETYDGENRWLVTSRPSAVDHRWLFEDNFAELTLSAMGPADIATFIKRWHAAARTSTDDGGELARYEAQLLTAVRTQPDLGRLATNPLMCGLICALHRDRRGYLPHGRKDLYEAALSMLLSRRDRERDMKVPSLREEPQLEVLQLIAYWLIKNGRTEMDRSRAEIIIGRAVPAIPEIAELGGASAVFDHFLERSGLLREPAPGTVDFIHRTFQDFLGARAAVAEGDFGLLVEHADDDQWEDVIRMAVALARPRERETIFQELLGRGERAPDRKVQTRIYLVAAACLEHATSLSPSVREAVERSTATLIPPRNEEEARALAEVGPLILHLLPGPEELDNDVAAFNTVIAASHITSEAAITFLARFVEHAFVPVRAQLVWAWSRFDSGQYADEIIARLKPDDLTYTVQSDEQLGHLRRLGLVPESLDVRAAVSVEALTLYLSHHRVGQLSLQGKPADLEFLSGQTELTSLIIRGCANLLDLRGIGGLGLRHLDLTTLRADIDLRALGELPQLESLVLGGAPGLRWSPRGLNSSARLRTLQVTDGAAPEGGLAGLSRFSELTSLGLCRESAPASAADWQEIRALPHLTDLSATAASLDMLEPEAVMASVTTLSLGGGGGERVVQAAVHRLPLAFPRLEYCEFVGDMRAEGDIDLTPLAALADLKDLYIAVSHDRVRGAEALSASVRLTFL
ncbi:ATP-binding protein [Streptomyces populi]|uniref:ATP-binding protein n=1 Tax=Streptomyces populi TaxID=2058924 RepID=A0A2I0SCR9_9ACTN|nr:NACHT domain-containing protein [Streptomyces populi]PKT67714.1 ATP-binding protein [Streptomyces populi]